MPKHYGEPYDPELRKTDHGSKLYWIWKKVRLDTDSAVFENFASFYDWAIDSGYESGDRLFLINNDKPHSPENCDWKLLRGAWIDDWNNTVNRVRKHYDMPPLEGTSYGD
jgi:hypothetical protein